MTTKFKYSDEQVYLGFDYVNRLDGETILTAIFMIVGPAITNDDVSMLTGTAVIDGTKVRNMVVGGTAGNSYSLSSLITTSAGRTLKGKLTLQVG